MAYQIIQPTAEKARIILDDFKTRDAGYDHLYHAQEIRRIFKDLGIYTKEIDKEITLAAQVCAKRNAVKAVEVLDKNTDPRDRAAIAYSEYQIRHMFSAAGVETVERGELPQPLEAQLQKAISSAISKLTPQG